MQPFCSSRCTHLPGSSVLKALVLTVGKLEAFLWELVKVSQPLLLAPASGKQQQPELWCN